VACENPACGRQGYPLTRCEDGLCRCRTCTDHFRNNGAERIPRAPGR
jgi:hypothetical protein